MSHFMMGTQFITLASRIGRWTWHPPKQYGGQFGIQISLPNDVIEFNGQQVVLERQSTWVNVDVSQTQVGKPSFQAVHTALQRGAGFFLATGGRVKVSPSGKQSLRFSLSNFRVRDNLSTGINSVLLDGNCKQINGRWILVAETYRIPNPKQGQSPFNERHVWVYLPYPMQLYVGHPIFVQGRLALKSPTGDSNIYVIANLVA